MTASLQLLAALCLSFALLTGCQSLPPRAAAPQSSADELSFPAELYQQLAQGQGQVFTLDAEQSSIWIYVYRAGPLAAQGHNHIVAAGSFEGAVYLPEQGLEQARFDLLIPLQELIVDPPAARAAVGGSFAGDVDAAARQGTRANMLGPAVLDAERFPQLAIRSVNIAGELPKLIVTTAVTVHGVTREQQVPVDVQLERNKLTARGALVVRQQDFGIQPMSALGGLLRVQDELLVEFVLDGQAL